jgi:16S rRNA (cytosine1402-N4)-methyltransferase
VVGQTLHVSVLRDEAVEWLRAREGGIFLDCTLGGGGHTQAILEANPENRVTALDRDSRAVSRATERLGIFAGRVRLEQRQFSGVDAIEGGELFDGVLADLGLSTDQLYEGRGFSFRDEDALDMRMNDLEGVTAAEIVNASPPKELYRVLREGGVDKEIRRIVSTIMDGRPFSSSKGLAEALRAALPRSEKGSHPATVVFQALRMAVNGESEELQGLLERVPAVVKPGGRLVIISFHSGEDKIVARTMRRWQSGGDFSSRWPGSTQQKSLGELLTKKALVPSEAEISANPASRSARMRVFQFSEERTYGDLS